MPDCDPAYGNEDGNDRDEQERRVELSSGRLHGLLGKLETASNEAAAENEKEVGKNRANKRRLHNGNLTLDKGNNGDNQLDDVAEGGVDETTNGLADTHRDFLGSEAKEARKRHDGNERHDEHDSVRDRGVAVGLDKVQGPAHGDKDEENVTAASADILGVAGGGEAARVVKCDGGTGH